MVVLGEDVVCVSLVLEVIDSLIHSGRRQVMVRTKQSRFDVNI